VTIASNTTDCCGRVDSCTFTTDWAGRWGYYSNGGPAPGVTCQYTVTKASYSSASTSFTVGAIEHTCPSEDLTVTTNAILGP
jgi:hypothetical protein